MATVFRNIWVNWLEKRLQQSNQNGGEFVLPDFHKYEQAPFRIRIVEPDPSSPLEGYALVSVGNLSLTMSINDTLDDSTPLAQQQTWLQNTMLNTFEGTLDLNTALMNSYVGSSTTGVSAWFQIHVTQTTGQPTPIYQRRITILNSVTQPTSVSPDVNNVYRTAAESDGTYLMPVTRPGQFITILSPDGTKARTIGIDNGGAPIDIVLNYP